MTAQQPENNVARVALQALAAVLSGVQSLHTNAMDEAWALPTEDAARVALRTQQIIAHETGVTDTVDPLGGSYYVEWLTDRLEEGAYEYFGRIAELGGVMAAIDNGFLVGEIADAAESYQRQLERRERLIVGVNEETAQERLDIPILRVDAEGERHHIDRLNRVRNDRDNSKVRLALQRLRRAGSGTDNLMPPILDAVRAYATLGEIMQVLREEWGERQPSWST